MMIQCQEKRRRIGHRFIDCFNGAAAQLAGSVVDTPWFGYLTCLQSVRAGPIQIIGAKTVTWPTRFESARFDNARLRQADFQYAISCLIACYL